MTAKWTIADDATNPPLNLTERSAPPSSPATHDIYLDDGTNTASTDPGLRRYNGSSWEDLGAGLGAGIGGSTGATDDALLTADGTGGATVQASGVTLVSGVMTGPAGGLQIIGGTGSGDDLTLDTTTDGTKGSYIFTDLTTDGLVQVASGVLSSSKTVDIDGGTIDGATIGGASAAAITGTTITGSSVTANAGAISVNRVGDTADGLVSVAVDAGQTGGFFFYTGATLRWSFTKNSAAESGSNVGSDFSVARYDDAGAFIAAALQITRSTGNVRIVTSLEIDGAFNHDGGTAGFFGTTPASQPTGYTTFANLSTDRTLDADSTTLAEVADVLGTVIEDLKTLGILAA